MSEELFQIKGIISRNEIPSPRPNTSTSYRRYARVWEAVELLIVGDWLPVEFATHTNAENLRVAAVYKGYIAKRRGSVVYISKRE